MKKIPKTIASILLAATSACFGQAWINEFHYDNAGADVGEFVEVFVGASYTGSLDDLRLSLYNGSDDELYGSNDEFTVGSDFTAGDTIPGVGTFYLLSLPANGLQNGAPDGLALSQLNGGTLQSVLQFISYEGVMGPAGDGDAVGLTSVDVGVEQGGTTPIGASIALSGIGDAFGDFVWINEDVATPGSLNNGQTISAPSGLQAPTGLSATRATAPDGKDTIVLEFTPDGGNDVLVVFNTEDAFGTPTDATTYASGDSLPAGGTVAGVFTASPVTVTDLVPGTQYFFKFFTIDSGNNYSAPSFTVSASTGTFALQVENFGQWTSVSVAGEDGWFISGNSSTGSGFGDSEPAEFWLISPELNLDLTVGELFEFDYSSRFVDTIVGLEAFYTTSYTGDPTTTTWVPFTATNADFETNKSADGDLTDVISTSVDLSSLSGTTVQLAFKYTSSGTVADETRSWILQNPLISGNGPTEAAITLSASPATVEEGASRTVNLSLPVAVSADTEFFLSSNGDGSELGFPASVTVLNGTDNVDFTVNGLTDNIFDTDQEVTLVANASGFVIDAIDIIVIDTDSAVIAGDLVITQYYEGSFGNNKYIEITNVSSGPLDVTGYTLVRWGNARAEEYKTATAEPSDNYDSLDLSPLGTLAAGQTVLLANTDATTPIAAQSADLTQGFPGALTFNGDDSLVIYNSSTPSPSAIVDAIGFTFAVKEGTDVSFVRASLNQGYDLSPGSNATSPQFSSIWSQIDLATANAAIFGDDAFLGSTDLATPPTSVFFTTASQTVAEEDGSFELSVAVANLDSGSVTVDITFNTGNSTADGTDITFSSPQQLTFDASSLVSPQSITVPIVDDGLDGGTEVASFDLSVSSGTAIVGTPSTQNVNIEDSDLVIPNVLISEVVDPGEAGQGGDGRYVELYNASGSPVDLGADNWNLVIYFNANGSGTNIPLTGTIPAGGTYIVAQSENFGTVYPGQTSDQTGNVNSNGDDNFELRFGGGQSGGTLVDVYGIPGTDGTGEPWEFEDSRAVRNADITSGNTTWTASEWTIEPSDFTLDNMTPGIHPESDVPAPSGVSATAVSESEIEIVFTPAAAQDVVILFNQTGSFTTPSGTPPAIGEAFAGGTVLFNGTVSPVAHTGLVPETDYFYAVYTFDGTDYSNVVLTSATTPIAGLINAEDFSNPTWFNDSVSGDDPWSLSSSDAFIDGALNVEDPAILDNHYLVSPELDFSSETGVSIRFDYAGSYDVTGLDSLELVYSTDYSGAAASATWTAISFDFSNITDQLVDVTAPDDFVNSGPIALPALLEGQTGIRLAFRYNNVDGEIENSEQWVIDNIVVQGSGTTPPTAPLDNYLTQRSLSLSDLENDTNGNGFTVIEEYFAGFGDGAGGDTIVYGIDPTGPALTLTSDLASDPDGVVVALLATSDLTTAFASVAFTVSSVDNGDGTFTRSYTETTPPSEADNRFYRLSITVEVD